MNDVLKGQLTDWRLHNGEDDTAPDVNKTPLPFRAESRPDGLMIFFQSETDHDVNERCFWIELEGSAVVVHVYDGHHEEPINLRLFESHIEVDDRDYRNSLEQELADAV